MAKLTKNNPQTESLINLKTAERLLHKKRRFQWTFSNIILVLVLILVILINVYPFWYVLVGAFNEGLDYTRGGVFFWPRKFTTSNFRMVFTDPAILSAFYITALKVVVGTLSSLLVTAAAAYAITRPGLRFKKLYITLIMFTMFFSGGLIPYFVLIDGLGLYDSFWVYILPGLFSVYNWLIMQSFMREISPAILESARIDGAGEYRSFFQIVLPLSRPVLATIALFVAVTHWNSYFDSMMFTSSPELTTIQLFLKRVITDPLSASQVGNSAASLMPTEAVRMTAQSIKMATMLVAALPIVVIYPFLQKHFVSGLTIGAVKG